MTHDRKTIAPRDLEWVERHWKTIAAMSALLAAAGYTVISPSQKVEALGSKIDRAHAVQALKDSTQDARTGRLELRTDTELREVREGIEDLMIAECIRSRDPAVRARLKCGVRMNGER